MEMVRNSYKYLTLSHLVIIIKTIKKGIRIIKKYFKRGDIYDEHI